MLLTAPALGNAQAWVPAGDASLRLAVEQLVDDGVLDMPILSWPISRRELKLAAGIARERGLPDARSEAALLEIEAALEPARREWSLALGDPQELRGFEDAPRESGEAALAWRWQGEGRLSGELHARAVLSPEDQQPLRPDGSYLAASTGNWLWSAGWQDRWWGGGHEGSLQFSSNARPVFALSMDRETSIPFESRWLSWLGHWTLGTFIGAQEGHRPDVNHSLLWGFRVAARPLPGLELSLTRNAQFCGDGRPCGLDAFWNVLVGNDNQGENVRPEDEPGNQLATLEARWGGRIASVPVAIYWQRTGETIDNKIPRPLRNMDLVGLSTWGELPKGARWRATMEFSETTCADKDASDPARGDCVAYENQIFTSGYRYRGRALGHSTDGDSRQWVLGLAASEAGGRQWAFDMRRAEINRIPGYRHPDHSVSTVPAIWYVGEARVEQPIGRARVEFAVAVERKTDELTSRTVNEPKGYLRWTRPF
jgi:hypothetical protein